ncbi:packaged DNA stabilization protein [Aurantiacibacter spongiae]|uniref:Uncharacterized protein n=1 Tax=Aurantiacibacter spongiae TaxID=2488860 RepID=A0A3N5CPZ6_9SPHN|nr:packaged DNA stabilization protein [Aurantiacibacter spongiae]RPF70446.1 hypothetical protein EG799_01485 [Aurantiacibacter spongiae]
MQVPIQSGVRSSESGYSTTFPVNLQHEVRESGISKGQLVTTRGATFFATGPGEDRGGAVFKGVHYRVMGSSLISVAADGSIAIIGDVGTDTRPAGFTQDFDRLAIRSAEKLFYYDGADLLKVADFDLGKVLDVDWMDGYFVTTDGEYLVVTDLLDPTSVDALKYGSAESDPDPITGVKVFEEELYGFGRYSVQVFRNVGSTGFPFQNVRGATISVGCVSADAKVRIGQTLAFVGGARDEPIGLYILAGGQATRVSPPEIDDMLVGVDEAAIVLEARTFGDEQHLVMHLPDRAVVLAIRATGQTGEGAWHIAHSGYFKRYRPRFAVYCYGRHIVGDIDSTALGVLSQDISEHFGDSIHWQFDAGLLFDQGNGFIVRETELFGRKPDGDATMWLSMTRDGETYSREIGRRMTGRREERMHWRPNCRVGQLIGLRFRGVGQVAVARCEVTGEALAV